MRHFLSDWVANTSRVSPMRRTKRREEEQKAERAVKDINSTIFDLKWREFWLWRTHLLFLSQRPLHFLLRNVSSPV